VHREADVARAGSGAVGGHGGAALLAFAELVGEELHEGGHGRLLFLPVGLDLDRDPIPAASIITP